MDLPLYLAMTAAEIMGSESLPPYPAWMACHFSAYDTGLSNMPKKLPKGAMIILNDRIPIAGHDPDRIADQLSNLVETFDASGILLDFERKQVEQTTQFVKSIVPLLRCRIGVSENYANAVSCPVFLSQPPLYMRLDAYLQPWADREVWLEIALDEVCVCVSKKGVSYESNHGKSSNPVHQDQSLFCSYQIETEDDAVKFLLHRSQKDIPPLLEYAKSLNVRCAIGLFQQLWQVETYMSSG